MNRKTIVFLALCVGVFLIGFCMTQVPIYQRPPFAIVDFVLVIIMTVMFFREVFGEFRH